MPTQEISFDLAAKAQRFWQKVRHKKRHEEIKSRRTGSMQQFEQSELTLCLGRCERTVIVSMCYNQKHFVVF